MTKSIVQRGLYFDELELDTVYEHRPRRTVSEADNILFTTLTMNTQALHLDAQWSESTEFGERLVNSMFTLSTLIGLSVAQLTQGTIVANLGFSEVRFPAPVRVGDTLAASTIVTDKRESKSRPGQGIATFEHTMRNQRDEVVCVAVRSTLMLLAPGSAEPGGLMHGPALLFCPADRPDRYAKALDAADSVIIDLEDAVGPENRASARESVVASHLDPSRTIVRVNPVGTPDFDLDVAALRQSDYRMVMLAKTESSQQLDALDDFDVIGLCETPAGVENAGLIAAVPHVTALMWGAEDLVGAIGGRSSRHTDGSYRDLARYARSRVLIAAAAAGKAAIDTVHLDIADLDGLQAEVEDAAAVGFAATACIHPSQVSVIRAGYAPSPDEVAWAERVLAAAESNSGVFRFEGRMVDGPVLRQARTVLARR